MQPTGVPAGWEAYGDERRERVGFFTDTSVCIGCKACEVACKEWNVIPEDGLVWTGESYTTRRRSAPTRGATSRSSSSASHCAPTVTPPRSTRSRCGG